MEIPKQLISKYIGAEGCYFCCLIRIAEKEANKTFDPCAVYSNAVLNGNLEDKTCYVINPPAILQSMTGNKYTIIKTDNISYVPKENEYIVRYYRYGSSGHFVLADKNNTKVEYDPYGVSQSVQKGTLHSLRIIKRVN